MKKELIKASDVQDVLLDIGIPANLLGFKYICYAEHVALNTDISYLRKLSKHMYIDVASVYGTTPTAVEHSMRNAIAAAWKYGDEDTIKTMFRNSVNPLKGTPTVSQFLLRIYYYIANNNYYD